ncbi:teicoplanin resistance protein VanZ [Streptococcus agalactiae LMG 14747]|uniref:Teicoplanin resistance protein VanZ n=2 Tax=Streptococcus TaxID=1301 RepID=V6Z1P0_STRAG|nr:VanZ family protein [Streptococcus acidominimus]ESV54663.1 teicoplanin resistance protein VanZ [Streptococcus agalactiae LMG 14747]SNV44391.1 VanZF domain protein [Streptococcus acidominimus]
MLGQFFDEKAQLKKAYRKPVGLALVLYAFLIVMMCFRPQSSVAGVTTPNIIYIGRLRLLLVPFNSFIHFNELDTLWERSWVLGQNVANVFLLYPLGIFIQLLWKKWERPQEALLLGLGVSVFIEVTQLILDLLFDFNRVFEVDDLWTNTLGVFLAYLTIRWLKNKQFSNKHL